MTDDWTTPLGTIEPTRRQTGSFAYLERYFVQRDGQPEVEVSQSDFVRAEQNAGFRPKPGLGPTATSGFSSDRMRGRVESAAAPLEQ